MRVAAYSGGDMVPSARARVRQYIAPLAHLGIVVKEYPLPWGNVLPRARSVRPFWATATALERAVKLIHSWSADVTWISRQLLPAFVPLHALARRPMILDVDDAVWLNTGGGRAQSLAQACDVVVCGNHFLANHFSQWNRNIIVIPTAVDTAWYQPASESDSEQRGQLTLGWTGTSGNFPFLYSIEPALVHVLAQRPHVRLLIVADRSPRFEQIASDRFTFQRWSPADERAAFARMSIGLMPLADNDWCNGKCSYKMLCYMAAGLPVVVTPAGMNREVLALGDAGFAADSQQQWIDSLIALIDDAGLRRHMGAQGRTVIETHFSLEKLTTHYAAVFHSLGQVRPAEAVVPAKPVRNGTQSPGSKAGILNSP